jgi:hypothetical protein
VARVCFLAIRNRGRFSAANAIQPQWTQDCTKPPIDVGAVEVNATLGDETIVNEDAGEQ